MVDTKNSNLDLKQFYPETLSITKIDENEHAIYIEMRSISRSIVCPHCGHITSKYHAVHKKKVQDIPIFGKTTYLNIYTRDYECDNPECSSITVTETIDGFINSYSRMTQRLINLISQMAIETSCTSAARILKMMNVKTSRDTVIRTLIREYDKLSVPTAGHYIGVDDFSYKKGQTYGTIIVDGDSHVPLAILEGRDGITLKEWLLNNKQVTAVSRDRANAYAKAISEVLPDSMQIADRFHLFQNLTDVVKEVVKQEVKCSQKEKGKKNAYHCG